MARRYDVRVGGHRFFFYYRPDTHTYRFNFDDVLHEGPAATLADARDLVRGIVRAGVAELPRFIDILAS